MIRETQVKLEKIIDDFTDDINKNIVSELEHKLYGTFPNRSHHIDEPGVAPSNVKMPLYVKR